MITPRRIGRIAGQLDDLTTLASTYCDAAQQRCFQDDPQRQRLEELYYYLSAALSVATDLTSLLNQSEAR